jgi:predicted component of type VI protein secretion system
MPWLTTEGASHQIAEGETVVGSGAQSDWRLASKALAARHFVMIRKASRVGIRPCGRDAVIAINGAQAGLDERDLHDGDTIDAGNARFLFSNERSGSFPAIPVGPAHLVDARGGVAHDLATSSVGIGRDRLNPVVVRDPTASRFHAEIRREAGGYVLHPFGSSGTLLNGRRIGSPERLRDGDRIEIANVELHFVAGAMPEGARRAERLADDETSHRPTVIQTTAMAIPSEPEQRARSTKWIWIAAVLVAAATIWLATR